MFFGTVNSKIFATLLWAVGAALIRLGSEQPASERPSGVEQTQSAAVPGRALALLGGMRAAVADVCWLRAHCAWERQDAAATKTWLEATVAADERPAYFWLNGARMLAYDLPKWQRDPNAPLAAQRQNEEGHAREALAFLERGLRWHGPDAAFYLEMADLLGRRCGDWPAAARYYRMAAETPGAPAHAARIYGELLRALGRPREALFWLRQLEPTLAADDPLARRDVVRARIEALERELAVP